MTVLGPFGQNPASKLRWRQTGLFRRDFLLYAGDAPVAHVHWHGRFSKTATIETATESWVVKGAPFTRSFRVYGPDMVSPVANLDAAWRGEGTLNFVDSRPWYVVRRRSKYFLWPRWALIDDHEDEVSKFAESTKFTLIYEIFVELSQNSGGHEFRPLPLIMALVSMTLDTRKRSSYIMG